MININYETSIYISIYFGIGLVLTLIMYQQLVTTTVKYIQDNNYIFSAYTQDELNSIVTTTVTLCIFIWPFALASIIVYKLEQVLGITYKE
jgi:hypothetical protein